RDETARRLLALARARRRRDRVGARDDPRTARAGPRRAADLRGPRRADGAVGPHRRHVRGPARRRGRRRRGRPGADRPADGRVGGRVVSAIPFAPRGFTIEPRWLPSVTLRVGLLAGSLLAALVVGALLLLALGEDPFAVYDSMVQSSFGTPLAFSQTLV